MDKTEELLKASFNRLEELIGEVRELRYKIKSVQGDVESLRAELRASWRKGRHDGGGSGAPGRAGFDGGEGGKAEGGPGDGGVGPEGAACAVGSAPGSGSGQGRPGAAGHVQEGSAAASGWGQGSPGDGGHGPDGTAGTPGHGPAEANAGHAGPGPVGGGPGDIAALALGYGSVAMGAELAAVGGGKAVPGRAAGGPGQAGPEGAAGRGRLEEGSLERRLRRIEERLDYLSNKWMELDEKVFHLQKRLHTSAPGT